MIAIVPMWSEFERKSNVILFLGFGRILQYSDAVKPKAEQYSSEDFVKQNREVEQQAVRTTVRACKTPWVSLLSAEFGKNNDVNRSRDLTKPSKPTAYLQASSAI